MSGRPEVEPPRIASGILVSALIRRIAGEGGQGTVLAKGDANAGAILIVIADRGVPNGVLERTLSPTGYGWTRTGPADLGEPAVLSDYLARRRRGDPDIWAVELDHPRAAALATELLG